MERLAKSAIYLGMGIVSSLFVLFLIMALPTMLDDAFDRWEWTDDDAVEQKMREKFSEHPAYKAIYERFPDAKEEMESYRASHGTMRIGVMNFETNSHLILYLDYSNYGDNMHARAVCVTDSEVTSESADSLFVEDFIRRTGCVDAAR